MKFVTNVTNLEYINREGGGNLTKIENFGIDLCPLQGPFVLLVSLSDVEFVTIVTNLE